jgi:hypothetical protein
VGTHLVGTVPGWHAARSSVQHAGTLPDPPPPRHPPVASRVWGVGAAARPTSEDGPSSDRCSRTFRRTTTGQGRPDSNVHSSEHLSSSSHPHQGRWPSVVEHRKCAAHPAVSVRRNLPPAWDEQAASLSGAASEPLNPDPEAIGLVGHRAGAEGPTFGISGALVFF